MGLLNSTSEPQPPSPSQPQHRSLWLPTSESLRDWWASEEVNDFLWSECNVSSRDSIVANAATLGLSLSEQGDYRTIVTAGTASLASTAASFPFDSLKSRLQVKEYKGIWDCARAVVREEGVRGFFRGVTIPLVTISFVRTSSFSIYFGTKEALHQRGYLSNPSSLRDTALSGAAGGATSGVIISCGSAPFELVKVQRQLEYLIAMQRGLIAEGQASAFRAQTGFQAAANIMQHHGGLRGFYLGFRMHILRDTLGTALYFGAYDTIRSLVHRNQKQSETSGSPTLFGVPGPVVSFLSGSTAGIASWLLVYPVDLVKTNVQQQALAREPVQRTGWQMFTHLLRERAPPAPSEGGSSVVGARDTFPKRFLRLYRGLGVSALRSFISHGLTWTIIETISEKISRKTGKPLSYTSPPPPIATQAER